MSHHTRDHRSLLAAAEKRLLVRLAGRLPRAIHSDHLTLLAFAAMTLSAAGFVLARWHPWTLWLVVAGLAVNWFGDSLDGTLARVRGAERPRYGFYVDHVLDIVGIAVLMSGLACSPFMSPVVALAVLVAYLMVAGEVFLATSVRSVFTMSFAGFGPTELRIVLALGTLALFGDPRVDLGGLGRFRLFDVGGAMAAAGMLVALGVAVCRNTLALARLEPRTTPPVPPRSPAPRAARTAGAVVLACVLGTDGAKPPDYGAEFVTNVGTLGAGGPVVGWIDASTPRGESSIRPLEVAGDDLQVCHQHGIGLFPSG